MSNVKFLSPTEFDDFLKKSLITDKELLNEDSHIKGIMTDLNKINNNKYIDIVIKNRDLLCQYGIEKLLDILTYLSNSSYSIIITIFRTKAFNFWECLFNSKYLEYNSLEYNINTRFIIQFINIYIDELSRLFNLRDYFKQKRVIKDIILSFVNNYTHHIDNSLTCFEYYAFLLNMAKGTCDLDIWQYYIECCIKTMEPIYVLNLLNQNKWVFSNIRVENILSL